MHLTAESSRLRVDTKVKVLRAILCWILGIPLFLCPLFAAELPLVQFESVFSTNGQITFTASSPRGEGTVAAVNYEVASMVVGIAGFTGRSTNHDFSIVWTNPIPGWYTAYCRVYDNFGNYFGEAEPLTLYILPDLEVVGIFESMGNQDVDPGGVATFKAKTVSDVGARYLWKVNGKEIPGANSDTLSITNVQPADEGFYSVQIETPLAIVPAETGHLMVHVKEPGYIHFENTEDTPTTPRENRGMRIRFECTDYWPQGLIVYDLLFMAGKSLDHMEQIGDRLHVVMRLTNSLDIVVYFDGKVRPIPFAQPGEEVFVQIIATPRFAKTVCQFSNCIRVKTGTVDQPARLELLRFPIYLEWPNPSPSVLKTFRSEEAGTTLLLDGGAYGYGSFDSEWRRNGLPVDLTQRDIVFWNCGGSCMSASVWTTIPSLSRVDVGSYKMYTGNSFHSMLSSPVRVVLFKSKPGRFIPSDTSVSDAKLAHLHFQGRDELKYRLETSRDFQRWDPQGEPHSSPNGDIAINVQTDNQQWLGFRMHLIEE